METLKTGLSNTEHELSQSRQTCKKLEAQVEVAASLTPTFMMYTYMRTYRMLVLCLHAHVGCFQHFHNL
jgi:hypothetical protein